jgi:hypothetical protein
MRVTLTWSEVVVAAQVGVRRQCIARRGRFRDRTHTRADTVRLWADDIEGACGELAAAKALGRYWSPDAQYRMGSADVGALQVRTTAIADGHLLVLDTDDDAARFVFVRGVVPTFDVVGWMTGHEAKAQAWARVLGDRQSLAYFVPAVALHDLDELRAASVAPVLAFPAARR